jgi:SAM-dependent methyltransferase
VGLDGSTEFVAMARSYSECEVLQQDFLAMALPERRFDGIFANASLFHVPSQELPRVLAELSETLRSRGVLFCSNPRGNNEEGLSGDRYSCFFDHDTWRDCVNRSRVLPGEALLPPAGTAAPQAVVALDRLAQRVRTFTNRDQAGRSALSDLGVWRMVRPSGSGSSSFADRRPEWQILRKRIGAEG